MTFKLLDLFCKQGGGRTAHSLEEAREAMGIDYMLWSDLVEAIPPAYTEYLGKQIWQALKK